MLYTFLTLLSVALIFDGIKILIESFGIADKYEGKRQPKDTTLVVSVYNNLDILDVIDSAKSEFEEMIIINDGSDNGAREVMVGIGERIEEIETEYGTLYIRDYKGRTIKVLDKENTGKVDSIHMGLNFVSTKYTFICDDDIKFSDEFELPVSLLENNEADAISFFVVPEPHIGNQLWYNIQLHEYVKSMQIGRRFAGKSKSVECVSGCSGLFRTERIKEFSKEHSSEWQGEDLERTLIELINDGRVIYSEQVIFTDVPKKFIELSKQRIFGWWGGLYRNIPKFWKIFLTKAHHNRIRFETLYNMVSLVLDPIKLFSLGLLFFHEAWIILGCLYFIYVLFEYFIYLKYSKMSIYKPKPQYILLYPIYGLIQLIYRILSGFYMLYKKFKRIFFIAMLILMGIVGSAFGQEKKDVDWTLSYNHTQYVLEGRDWEPNHNIYVGRNNLYASVNQGLYDQLNVGMYHKNFLFDIGLRRNTFAPYVMYEHWLGNQTIRGHARYNYNYGDIDTEVWSNTTILGIGTVRYSGNSIYSLDIFREFDREFATIAIGKLKREIIDDIFILGTASINSQKDYMYSVGTQVYMFNVYYSYYNDFDFTGKYLNNINVGITLKF